MQRSKRHVAFVRLYFGLSWFINKCMLIDYIGNDKNGNPMLRHGSVNIHQSIQFVSVFIDLIMPGVQ